MKDEKRFRIYDTHFNIKWDNDRQCHRDLNDLFSKLRERGWVIDVNEETLKRFPSIAKDYFQGKYGDLKFKSSRYQTGFEIEFYQDVNIKNKNGGQYDFDKLEKMPYLIKLRYLIESKFIIDFLINLNYINSSDIHFKDSYEEVIHRIKSCWHYKEGKELPEYKFEDYNSTDKYKRKLRNGQIKYFRDRKGNIMRGTIYHNINNMWWTILSKDNFTNIASFEFFDLGDEPNYLRKEYSRKMPQRIRTGKLRERFNSNYTYKDLNEYDVMVLRNLIDVELLKSDKDMDMCLSLPKKKDMKVLKTKGLVHCAIKVNGSYFKEREAITFHSDRFIGFVGWADGRNIKPFADAFEKWLEWLDEVIKK